MRRAVALLVAAFVLIAPDTGATAIGTPRPADVKPRIVVKKIPFGTRRKRQTAGYSRRHYGERTFVLGDPRVVVEHYTDGTSFDSAWNHFASNAIHLGERPGVCAHFVIDTDGTIYRLVNLRLRCRHAIGMNWTAIGIEHVGTSARDILRDRDMMRASLRLTAWLMRRRSLLGWRSVKPVMTEWTVPDSARRMRSASARSAGFPKISSPRTVIVSAARIVAAECWSAMLRALKKASDSAYEAGSTRDLCSAGSSSGGYTTLN